MFKKQLPAFLLAFVLPILLVYAWWGGFNSAQVTPMEAGPYRYAYLEYEGPISDMRKTQKMVLQGFINARVAEGDTLVVVLTDPRKANGKVKAQVGYTLEMSSAIPKGLKEGMIPRRPVLVAKVRAAILLAPSKAYQAMHDYLQSHAGGNQQAGDITMPTLEIFHPGEKIAETGEFTLEMNR